MLIAQTNSSDLPSHEQFGTVRDSLMAAPIPVRLERHGVATTTPFAATTRLHAFGSDILAAETTGEGADGYRTAPEMARTSADCFWIVHYTLGAGPVELGGEPVTVGAGDILFGDCGVGMIGGGSPQVGYTMWMLPCALMQPLLARAYGDPKGMLRGTEPLGRLAGAYLQHLGAAMDAVGPGSAAPLMTNVAAMLALTQGIGDHAAEVAQGAIAAARLRSIKRMIAARYADPGLSPRLAAAEHGISVRTVHLLFEPTGKSFGRCLMETRLAAAHAMLADPSHRRRTVVDIVYACGFEGPSTFYRAFRDRYGYSPAELRMGR